MTLEDEIRQVLQQCTDWASEERAAGWILPIIEELRDMLRTLEAGRWESRNRALARGLGYLVLDDYAISKSELGHRLAKIANAWAGEK